MNDGVPIDCKKCGQPHTRCTAHAKNRDGKPCKMPRMKGQTVCRMHGGAAPAARKAGLRRYELEKATADYHAKIAHTAAPGQGIVNPLDILAELTAEALAMKDALAKRVNALDSLRFTDDKTGEQLRSEVALYERALDRSARFVDLMAKSGFEDARVKLQQQQGLLVAHVLKRIMEALELSEHQQTIAGQVVPMELRKLEGEAR